MRKVDSGNRADVRRSVADAGPLDIIVANAGVAFFADPREADPDAVDRMIDVNVRAPWHAFAEAARTMNDGGRMVVIGSVNGDRMPMAMGAAYGHDEGGDAGHGARLGARSRRPRHNGERRAAGAGGHGDEPRRRTHEGT